MAGPVASVLTSDLVNGQELELLLGTFGPVNRTHNGLDLSVTDGRAMGVEIDPGGRPFLVRWQRPELTQAEATCVAEAFDVEPTAEIVLAAMCNQPDDHRVLGNLALLIAQSSSGVVNFCGALLPPAWRRRAFWEAAWSAVQCDFQDWATSMPGKIISLPYETEGGRTWATHIADTVFLARWLQAPDFYMVK